MVTSGDLTLLCGPVHWGRFVCEMTRSTCKKQRPIPRRQDLIVEVKQPVWIKEMGTIREKIGEVHELE